MFTNLIIDWRRVIFEIFLALICLVIGHQYAVFTIKNNIKILLKKLLKGEQQ